MSSPADNTKRSGGPTLPRRSLLRAAVVGAAAGGSDAAGAQLRNSPDFGGKRIDVRDFGARGDRQHDDGPAIAAAIAAAARHDQYPASVFLPAGHYHRREPIALPDHLNLVGEGPASVLNSQWDRNYGGPILINAAPSGLVHARLSELSLVGGSHGLKLSTVAENADLRLTGIGMTLQSIANIEVDKLFQTAKFINCNFAHAPYGLKVNGYGTNLLTVIACEWTDHQDAAIFLRGTEAVTIVGNRFEGGGRAGKTCIDIEDANTISFVGCWFEDTHEILARFRRVAGQIVFQSCHFTGTKLGGAAWQAFRWDLADCRVAFRDCLSMVPMAVDGHVSLDGSVGISASHAIVAGSDRAGSVTASPRPLEKFPAAFLAIAGSGPGRWSIIGRLTIMLLADDDTVLWRRDTGDVLLRSDMQRHSLLDTPELNIAARPGERGRVVFDAQPLSSVNGRLRWRFDWEAIGGGVSVRAL